MSASLILIYTFLIKEKTFEQNYNMVFVQYEIVSIYSN